MVFLLQENFDAALRAAEDQAAGNPTTLAAIDKNALFAQHAGGSKGRQLGRGNLVRAERCGVVDPTAALVQQNQQLQETIKLLTQQHELFLQQLSTALAQNNNINLQLPTFPQTASQPSSIGLNQPSETNQNQEPAEETHEDEAEAENDEGEENEGDQ
ncbi:hypothetical protein COLO4_36063 [Corchorus olitorius]|uniref:Uncharacterized protein n=1 Tax=Corchorus olitorius TaxID=93759 RepID=A0A1R3GB60_9ROSI|nr:hypothetical protein COLO4_36063 [Corchorus olitorius]